MVCCWRGATDVADCADGKLGELRMSCFAGACARISRIALMGSWGSYGCPASQAHVSREGRMVQGGAGTAGTAGGQDGVGQAFLSATSELAVRFLREGRSRGG